MNQVDAPPVGARIRYPKGGVQVTAAYGARTVGHVPAGAEGEVVGVPGGEMGEAGWRITRPDVHVPAGAAAPVPPPDGALALVHPLNIEPA